LSSSLQDRRRAHDGRPSYRSSADDYSPSQMYARYCPVAAVVLTQTRPNACCIVPWHRVGEHTHNGGTAQVAPASGFTATPGFTTKTPPKTKKQERLCLAWLRTSASARQLTHLSFGKCVYTERTRHSTSSTATDRNERRRDSRRSALVSFPAICMSTQHVPPSEVCFMFSCFSLS
jgi:hypothetical protein